jgi:protein TonB
MFPGGEEAMSEFLADHIHFTNHAKVNEIEGKVMLNFVIDEEGNIKECKILRGLGFGLDEVAIKAVNQMPKWIPAEQGHRKVAVVFTLPIEFLLH